MQAYWYDTHQSSSLSIILFAGDSARRSQLHEAWGGVHLWLRELGTLILILIRTPTLTLTSGVRKDTARDLSARLISRDPTSGMSTDGRHLAAAVRLAWPIDESQSLVVATHNKKIHLLTFTTSVSLYSRVLLVTKHPTTHIWLHSPFFGHDLMRRASKSTKPPPKNQFRNMRFSCHSGVTSFLKPFQNPFHQFSNYSFCSIVLFNSIVFWFLLDHCNIGCWWKQCSFWGLYFPPPGQALLGYLIYFSKGLCAEQA